MLHVTPLAASRTPHASHLMPHTFQPPTSSDVADYVGRSPKLSLTTEAYPELAEG